MKMRTQLLLMVGVLLVAVSAKCMSANCLWLCNDGDAEAEYRLYAFPGQQPDWVCQVSADEYRGDYYWAVNGNVNGTTYSHDVLVEVVSTQYCAGVCWSNPAVISRKQTAPSAYEPGAIDASFYVPHYYCNVE